MDVGAICNRDVIVIRGTDSLVSAARLMRDQHVGSLVVVETVGAEEIPVGIVTDRDIVVSVVAQDVDDIFRLNVSDVATGDLVTVLESDTPDDALTSMRRNGVRRAPVVNHHGSLVGILAVDDLVQHLADQMENVVRLVAQEQQVERELRV